MRPRMAWDYGWRKRGGVLGGDPDPIFRVDFTDGSTTPQTGVGPSTYTRASEAKYPDGTAHDDITTYATGVAAVETFPYLLSTTEGGISFSPQTRNFVLHSNSPANAAWTLIGTAAANDASNTGPDNVASSAGDIVSSATGDGIQQSVAIAVASQIFTGSVYVKVASGTEAWTIKVEGDSGGTPETASVNFTATTTWQRAPAVSFKSFSAAATGNIRLEIISQAASASSTLQVFDMQVEQGFSAGFISVAPWQKPFTTITTTTVAVLTDEDKLQYAASNFASATATGSLMFWLNMPASQDEIVTDQYIVSMDPGGALAIRFEADLKTRVVYNGSSPIVTAAEALTWTAQEWFLIAITWDQPGDFYGLYKNGVLIDSDNSTLAEMTAGILEVGNLYNGGRASGWQGVMSRFRVYAEALDAAQLVNLFDDEKGDYGL